MRGDIVYRVYGVHEGRENDYFFGAYRTVSEAEAQIKSLNAAEMNGRNWAKQYHNKGFVIRSVVVDTDFEIPTPPKPRDKYFARASRKPNHPGAWDSAIVQIFQRGDPHGDMKEICAYERNYTLLQTFEPFRQRKRDFALISRDYTMTAVLDLASGKVIAEEAEEYYGGDPTRPGAGFCPVGFYVPDWWDVHDGSIIPGSESWNRDREWPDGSFGFVWGCYWGDDSSWKIQYLDLSRIQEGIIRRDDRFGYVELATTGYESPCLIPSRTAPGVPSKPPPFIGVTQYDGIPRVTFAVEVQFDINTGHCCDWERRHEDDEEDAESE